MPHHSHSLLDLRAWRRREDRRLILIIILFLVAVGGVVIGLVYGWGTALTSVLCLAIGAAILGLLWLILVLVERWIERE
jgi:fatty acid desaturase